LSGTDSPRSVKHPWLNRFSPFHSDRLQWLVMKRKIPPAFSYSVFYEKAPEGGYAALVPALPGCHTQGETLEETESNVKEAIGVYLESLAAHGEAIPEEGPSFQGKVTVPVPA